MKGRIITVVVWLVIFAAVAVAFKVWVLPSKEGELIDSTGSGSVYDDSVNIHLDSFSGYAFLRSERLKRYMRDQRIDLKIEDDEANYGKRLAALESGEADLAVFTIDAYLKAGASKGKFPGTIVAVIDETKGADALMVNHPDIKTIQDLNRDDLKFVFTPDSPSEFLARIVLSNFYLPKLASSNWAQTASGANDVYQQMKSVNQKRAYILWEPYITKATQNGKGQVLLDSSQMEGYIVDVLVANRKFLSKNKTLVKTVIENYFRCVYEVNQEGGVEEMIASDAKNTGTPLSAGEAKKISTKIAWKNTTENYEYFSIMPNQKQSMESIIRKINDVLMKTKAVEKNHIENGAHFLYYDGIFKEMNGEGFHPAKKGIVSGVQLSPEMSASKTVLSALSDQEWKQLLLVGQMNVEPINFGRGGSKINLHSQRALKSLAEKLESWPNYYLVVTGHARNVGDRQANLALAKSRAESVVKFLKNNKVQSERIRAEIGDIKGSDVRFQSVSFLFKQKPF